VAPRFLDSITNILLHAKRGKGKELENIVCRK
jgi:hypothetical protein